MQNDRRRALRLAGLSMLATAAGAWPAASRAAREPYQVGGFGGIVRGRFAFPAMGTDGQYDTVPLPAAGYVFMVPVSATTFDESDGTRWGLDGDGLITIRRTGLYQITGNLDWPGQHGVDTGMREIFIRRVALGQPKPVYTPGQVTLLPASGEHYDNLVAVDLPGSDVPRVNRTTVGWTPGRIAVGGMASVDVPLPAGSWQAKTGDGVVAALTSLSDATLGEANRGLVLTARVVGPDLVRVWLENRYNAASVWVPAGKLNVMAQSTVAATGQSADGWVYATTPTVMLRAGEKLIVAAKSETKGDWIQLTDATFVQITQFA